MPVSASRTSGFTLLELSIVLVIIGLLAGGVLVGQDLIKAAELRATTAQYEKFKTALNVFNVKYNGMPGDLYYRNAQRFGFFSTGLDGTVGLGDGNRVLEDPDQSQGVQSGEPLIFWRHLTDAALVEGRFGATLNNGGDPDGTVVEDHVPTAKLGGGNYFMTYSDGYTNYFLITGLNSMAADYTAINRITPNEAYNLDQKLDDGLPISGIVRARGGSDATPGDPNWSTATAASAARGDCVTGGANASATGSIYALNPTAGKAFACRLSLEF